MTRAISVPYLARVPGEAALAVTLRDGAPAEVRLDIFEPPRFVEGILRGREPGDAPDVTARICGICPHAHALAAALALEGVAGVNPGPEVRALRRLLHCGSWIDSHALHLFALHLPGFLGYPDASRMARDHRRLVETGLRLRRAGSAICAAVAGRAIHAVNVRVGGFASAPRAEALEALLPELAWGAAAALELLPRLSRLRFPELRRDYELLALVHPGEYAFFEGRLASTGGLDAPAEAFSREVEEFHVPRSNALHSRLRGRGAFLTGPLARFALSFDRLSAGARRAARLAGVDPGLRNPFKALLVRLVEMVHCLEEAAALIQAYRPPDPPFVEAPPRAGSGSALLEAPRGLLHHAYQVGRDGLLAGARIAVPTSHNLEPMEGDLAALAPQLAALPPAAATRLAEQAVRNHDPCISCSTHFLRVRVERSAPREGPPAAARAATARVVALGRRGSGDDAAGPAVLDRLRALAPAGVELLEAPDPSALLEWLRSGGPVVVVDALAGAPAGEVRVLGADDLPAEEEGLSTHGLTLSQVVSLARSLGAAPPAAVVGLGVGPAPQCQGEQLSPGVAAGVEEAARRVKQLLGCSTRRPSGDAPSDPNG
ncbi:MAG TPA: hydrogenase maturation protease [Anaeromyxobacteraceae bacterium]|nr:hydrogenase maturation protease [Anaeromyxobacteraceae bacterium]